MPIYIEKEIIDWVKTLADMRDKYPKKERDRRMRLMRQDLMGMINGTHLLVCCHEEKEIK